MLLWYEDYSELKATKTLWAQEKLLLLLSLPPLNYLEEFKLGAWPIIRVITRNDYDLSIEAGQTSNY